jgi:hypothetical protein
LTTTFCETPSGLVPGEDAPDIIANTFLQTITPEQIERVGKGFLCHRECKLSFIYDFRLTEIASLVRCAINGHLAWTAQHASGNRGDDFRALKLCELQPYTFLHPNGRTPLPCVLGLQGEEKAGASRGMRTVHSLTQFTLRIWPHPISYDFFRK